MSEIDSDAFVFCTSVSEVIGRGFSIPPKKKQKGDAEALENNQSIASTYNKENATIENTQIENTSAAVTSNANPEASKTQAETLENTKEDNKPTQEKTTSKKAKTSSNRTKQKVATKEVK